MIVLDLCGGTGSWSAPYRENGYDVRLVTLESGLDVRTYEPPEEVHGILAAPPCTHFSSSGARWWPEKDADGRTLESLEVARACLRIIRQCEPRFWALEQPVGRFRRLLAPELTAMTGSTHPRYSFHPCHHGDPWTKLTQLFGRFFIPARNEVFPELGSLSDSKGRQQRRAVTLAGFATAFFLANP